jgi:hypothetical protein
MGALFELLIYAKRGVLRTGDLRMEVERDVLDANDHS